MNNYPDRYGVCVVCDVVYDYTTEPSEIKEGSEHICPTCWAIEE